VIQEVEREVENVILKTETSLRGGLSHIHLGVPIEHLPFDSNSNSNSNNIVNTDTNTNINSNSNSITSSSSSSSSNDEIHVIFSTDCSPYQDWQTILLFHSAKVVGQKGPITRIASGCDDIKKTYLTNLYKELYPEYYVHFTPDFKKDEKTNKKYDFYNKPWGLKHWLEFAVPSIPDNIIVALIDPDMIFLRPLTPKIKGEVNLLHSKRIKEDEIFDRVQKGKPVAQTYGLGAPWTNDNHKKFNRGKICGEGSPCLEPNENFGNLHYSVGPPYLVEKTDIVKIAKSWTTFVPRVYEGYPYLLAEMYAYSMAAAHEKLPHLQVEHMMLSNTDAGDEGWPLVDNMEDACIPPVNGIYYPDKPLPTFAHYCQIFRAGYLGFAKRQVPKDIFTCESPMFVEPWSNLSSIDWQIKNGEKVPLNKKMATRNSFMLCVLHRSINAALLDFKTRHCKDKPANYNKEIVVLKKG